MIVLGHLRFALTVALATSTGCDSTLVRDPVEDDEVSTAQTSGTETSVGPGYAAIAAQSGVGGDASEPSTGGGGAGGADVVEGPHTIEIALRPVPAGGDLDGVQVVVSDVDGNLRHQLEAGDLPAEVEVVDGDLVSVLRPRASWVHSYRVTPEVTRIERDIDAHVLVEGEPMDVTVIIPEVAGAEQYVLEMERGPYFFDLDAGSHSFQLLDGYYAPQRVIVRAMSEGALVAYSVFELLYESGAERTISPEMHIERVSFDLDVTSLEGASSVRAGAYWWLRVLNAGPWPIEELDDPPPTWSFSGSVIAPDFEGGRRLAANVLFDAVDGRCPRAELHHQGTEGGHFTFDAAGLRAPAFAGDLYTLGEVGALGDLLWRVFEYRTDDDDLGHMTWFVEDDPARPAIPATFPNLGPGAPPRLVPIDGSMVATVISNRDTGRGSYAAHVARDDDPLKRTMRARTLGGCD